MIHRIAEAVQGEAVDFLDAGGSIVGTQMCTSVSVSSAPSLPSDRPVSATTVMSLACAAPTAASTLPELPLVLIAMSKSPGLPNA